MGRVTAKARANVAASLEQAGMHVLSDPNREPLVVAKPAPPTAAATSRAPDENPGGTRRRSLIALGIALSGGDEEADQASNPSPSSQTDATSLRPRQQSRPKPWPMPSGRFATTTTTWLWP